MLTPHQVERAVRYTSASLSQAAYNRRLAAPARIAYDEWNVWYRTSDGALEERYDWSDALGVATYLNIFVRHCDWVVMANLAQLVNAIAPVVTTETTAAVQTIYYPFLLQSEAALEFAADVAVTGPAVEAPAQPRDRWEHRLTDMGPFCVLDAAATCDRDTQRVAVTVVNRGDEELATDVCLREVAWSGQVRARVLTAGETGAGDLGLDQVHLEEGSEDAKGARVRIALPARSFSVFEGEVSHGT